MASQNSQGKRHSQSQKSRADDLTEEQLEAFVQNVTAFLLCEMRHKRKLRKDDIVTNALNKSARQYAVIMRRVKGNLSNIFGLQLAKLPDKDDAFIIVNKHREKFGDLIQESSTVEDTQTDLVLTVVLGAIFMNRGYMYESHLMTLLEIIGFFRERFYGRFGPYKVKEHVTNLVKKTFVKQMYLGSEVVPRPQQEQIPPLPEDEVKVTKYCWGYRSLLEIDVDKVVAYLTKMYDGNKPPGYPTSYYNELKSRQQQMLQNMSV